MSSFGANRRDFLNQLLLAAAPIPMLGACDGKPCKKGTDGDVVRMAVIGAGGFGKKHVARLADRKDVVLQYICDADLARANLRADEAEKLSGRRPQVVQDMRTIFDDKNVDAVSMATPHHWHAVGGVWAMQAGKDLYLEKPVSHAFNEGEVLVAAARKLGRVCQAGLHRRANPSLAAGAEYVRSGQLGKVSLATCLTWLRRKGIGEPGTFPVPDTVNLDLWAGPAPLKAPARKRFHYDWHWSWETGNGAIGNNGVHRVDLVRWALGLKGLGDFTMSYGARTGTPDAGETPNSHITLQKFGDTTVVQDIRGRSTEKHSYCNNGVVIEGEDGIIVCCSKQATLFETNGTKVKTFAGEQEESFCSFLDAVRNENPSLVACDIEEGHLSSALCHLSNVSYRLGGKVDDEVVQAAVDKLDIDDRARRLMSETRTHLTESGSKARFVVGATLDTSGDRVRNNSDAVALLERTYRAPYVLPKLSEL